jgi:hypothetical protein
VDDDRFAYYRDLLDRWQWLEVALCVTSTHGAGQDDVVRAFGGDPGDTVPLTNCLSATGRARRRAWSGPTHYAG